MHPIWLDRYALWSVGALVVLVAYGLTAARDTAACSSIVVIVVAVLASRGVVDWYRAPPYEDYHSAIGAAQPAPATRRRDHLLARRGAHPGRVLPAATTPADSPRAPLPPDPWGSFKTGEQHVVPFFDSTIDPPPTRAATASGSSRST